MHYKVLRPFDSRVPPYKDKGAWKQWFREKGLPHVIDCCSIAGGYLEDLLGIVAPDEFEEVDYFRSQQMFLINNLKFAQKKAAQYPGSRIFGVQFDPDPASFRVTTNLLGFDLLDRGGHYSLLEYPQDLNDHFGRQILNQYALIDTLEVAIQLRTFLRSNSTKPDWHAATCEVWAVFNVNQ